MIPTSTQVTIRLSRQAPASAGAVAVFVHKQTRPDVKIPALPADAQTALRAILSGTPSAGKSNEVNVQLLEKNRRLIVVGLGNREKFSAECLREGAGALAKAVKKFRLDSVALVLGEVPEKLPGVPDGAPIDAAGRATAAEAIVNGFLLASFEYQEYKGVASKKKENDSPGQVEFTLVGEDVESLRPAVERGRIIADAQNFARTIASRPGNDINPPALARLAQQMARELKLTCRVLDEKQMKRLGMGGILAVGAGSSKTPPRMIVLEWKGLGVGGRGSGKKGLTPHPSPPTPLLVVGKAITFDTGGISIKQADKMGRMIYDKCGGMAVLGLMYAVAKLRLPIHLVGILASAENHISASAYRPGDILKMHNGVTVEVTNTDAEGRLVLGDALAWGIETFKPRAVVDLATLTGGVVVALGHTMAGMMGNDDALCDAIRKCSEQAGEKVWRLPVGEAQREQMKSQHADILNSAGRDGTPLQGAAFLSYFVPEKGTPWVHLDIAGVADTDKEQPFYCKGATGWGVRTLVQWVSTTKH